MNRKRRNRTKQPTNENKWYSVLIPDGDDPCALQARYPDLDLRTLNSVDGETVEILIFDEIGFFGVTAEDFIKDLNSIDAKNINLRINSPGGAVFEGMAIFNAIQRHSAKVTTFVDGLAASIASVIAMAGDEVVMAENSHIMIHSAWSFVIGNAKDMRKEADVLDRVDQTIAQIYSKRTDLAIEDVKALMDEETWFLADEAEDVGLIDRVEGEANKENSFDLSIFNHVPYELMKTPDDNDPDFIYSKTNIERALRNAGLSRSESRGIIAKGFDSSLRKASETTKKTAQELINELKNYHSTER